MIDLTNRYTACVNFEIGDGEYKVHVCNFLPVVVGSRLDLLYRGMTGDLDVDEKLDEILPHRLGHVLMFDNFCVFSSFISTDSRQCHRYKERTKNSKSIVRMYIYDSFGKGHMLFIQDDALYIRDKYRRETCLIDERNRCVLDDECGGTDDGRTIAMDFANATLLPPYHAITTTDFFRACREYMLHGIGGVCDDVIDGGDRLGKQVRDIDHIDNKRISGVPNLYGILMNSYVRNVRECVASIVTTGDDSVATTDSDAIATIVKSCTMRYGIMSHRANLLPFISRKTHIRQDWCETMKRQMKSEIRSQRRIRNVATQQIGATTVTVANARVGPNGELFLTVAMPDVSQDNTKIAQQFYCSKLHLDVEYDHEILKRMRVINLNAMNCLRMPFQFERFISHYNVGNIGNAGRVMTRTHGMRDSYIPELDATITDTIRWLRSFFDEYDDAIVETESSVIVLVNEMPILKKKVFFSELNTTSSSSSSNFSLWRLILSTKYREPGVTFVVTPHARDRKSFCVNVRIVNGIPLCPINVVFAREINDFADAIRANNESASAERYASHCNDCCEYRSPACLTLCFQTSSSDDDETFPVRRSPPLRRCKKHVWFSRHELSLYYQTFDNLREPQPLVHELACHGFLSVSCYPFITDISKIIVSINAHRRALMTKTTYSKRSIESWIKYGETNGKFARLTARRPSSMTITPPRSRLVPKNAIRLMFAFGDVDMLNCEDGYVLNSKFPLLTETLLRKKISLTCKPNTVMEFVSDMAITFDPNRGCRLHVGTLLSSTRVAVSCGNEVTVYYRNETVKVLEKVMYGCDIYVTWNASFVQSKVNGDCTPKQRKRTTINDTAPLDGGQCMFKEECEDYRFVDGGEEPTNNDCPISFSSVELYQRYLRISVCTKPLQLTIKLQNSFGQKGIAHYADMSELVTDRGEPINVISSMYSLIGRSAGGQVLEQRFEGLRQVYSKSSGVRLGVAGYAHFFVSSDFTHNHFIYYMKHGGANPMRLCRLTYEALLENNSSSVAYCKSTDFESAITNPYAGEPRTVVNALNCYNVYQRNVHMYSQRTLNVRKRIYDAALIDSLNNNDDAGTKTNKKKKM